MLPILEDYEVEHKIAMKRTKATRAKASESEKIIPSRKTEN